MQRRQVYSRLLPRSNRYRGNVDYKEMLDSKAYIVDSAASKLQPRHRLPRLPNALPPTAPAFAKTLALPVRVAIMWLTIALVQMTSR